MSIDSTSTAVVPAIPSKQVDRGVAVAAPAPGSTSLAKAATVLLGRWLFALIFLMAVPGHFSSQTRLHCRRAPGCHHGQ